MVGENGMVRAWLAWNNPREIKKTVPAQSERSAFGEAVRTRSARGETSAKSQSK